MRRSIAAFIILASVSFTSCAVAAPPDEASDDVQETSDRKYSNIEELFLYWEEYGYPDYVSGVFSPGGSTSCLTVLLVRGDESRENQIRDSLTDTYGLSFITAEYSYNELLAVSDEIAEKYMVSGSKIYGTGIGWESAGRGFGESGKEFRVVVTVDESVLTEYEKRFHLLYGDIVEVEAGSPVTLL